VDESRMFQHVLVTDDKNGNFVRPQQVVNPHERLQEINDQVRLRFADGFANRRQAFFASRKALDKARQRSGEGDAPVSLERKARAHDRTHRRRKCPLKERGQAARRVRPGQDRHDPMPTPLQHLAHRDGLRHVAPALPLHGEHYFHGI
jgi:hypothetical protein